MRETSNLLSKQNSQQPKQFRGGEKKVMKKSLSLLVAIAMVFSMFATVVSAAESEKTAGQYLNELGVIKGNGTDLKEDQTWKRKDVVILLAQLMGKTDEAKNAEKTHKFEDVTDKFYDGFISWVSEAKLMVGKSETKFGYNDELKNQDLFAIILRALDAKVEYADVPANAIKYGFATEETDMNAIPLRGATYEVIVTALKTVVPGTGQTLEEVLGLVEVTELAVAKAEQTNGREITVSFNKAVSEEQQKDLTFDLKKGTLSYTVTAKYAEDARSVVLSSEYLPEGEYQLTVKGFEAVTVKVVKEVATKIEVSALTLQRAKNQDPQAKLLNQFDKEIKNAGLNVTVYNASKGTTVSPVSGKYDLTGGLVDNVPNKFKFDVDDTVIVTVTHNSGLSANKTYKLVAGSAATVIKIDTVQPLKDKKRISAGDEGLVLPIQLLDQYGNVIKLGEKSSTTLADTVSNFEESGITFLLSQPGVISSYSIDDKGVLTFDVVKAGTLVLHATNVATGASASTTIKVEGKPVLKNLNMEAPTVFVASGEEVKVPYNAIDIFDDAIKAKDIKINTTGVAQTDEVSFNSSVNFEAGYPKFNAKGELLIKFKNVTAESTAYVTAYINGAPAGQFSTQVKPASTDLKVNGLKNVLTTMVNGATVEINKDKVTTLDDYGRTKTVANVVYNDAATPGAVNLTQVDGVSANVVTTGGKIEIKATGTTGVSKFKLAINNKPESVYEFSVKVVQVSDVKSYTIKSIGTIYSGKVDGDEQDATSPYAKTVELVGKIGGTEVALVQADAFDFVSAESTNNVVVADTLGHVVFGLAEGTATVTAYKNGEKLAETTVTTSNAKPVATKVEFAKSEYAVPNNQSEIDFVVNPAANTTVTGVKITVKDQYDVATNVNGNLSTKDTAIAKVVNGKLVRQGNATGQVTVMYMTTNGVSATAIVVFE